MLHRTAELNVVQFELAADVGDANSMLALFHNKAKGDSVTCIRCGFDAFQSFDSRGILNRVEMQSFHFGEQMLSVHSNIYHNWFGISTKKSVLEPDLVLTSSRCIKLPFNICTFF